MRERENLSDTGSIMCDIIPYNYGIYEDLGDVGWIILLGFWGLVKTI